MVLRGKSHSSDAESEYEVSNDARYPPECSPIDF